VGRAQKGVRVRGQATWLAFSACVRVWVNGVVGKIELTGLAHGPERERERECGVNDSRR
jgi:hypothetical protein